MCSFRDFLSALAILFFVSTGFAQDVSMLFDLNTDSSNISSYPRQFTEFDNQLFFSALSGDHGFVLWLIDEENNPEAIIDDKNIHPRIMYLSVANNKLYFLSGDNSDDNKLYSYSHETGYEEDLLISEALNENESIRRIIAFKNKLMLFIRDNVEYSIKMLEYDGLNAPDEINLPENIMPSSFSYPIPTRSQFYFWVTDEESAAGQEQLWSYDGENNPVNLSEAFDMSILSRAIDIQAFGDSLYITYLEDETRNVHFYLFDNHNQPVQIHIFDNRAELITVFKNEAYIMQDSTLWKYDFEGNGQIAFDIPLNFSAYNRSIVPQSDNYIYFFSGGWGPDAIYRFDGTNEPDTICQFPFSLNQTQEVFLYDNMLFMNADNGLNGDELLMVDIENSAFEYSDLNAGNAGSQVNYMTKFNDVLYFMAHNGNEFGLWAYDGANEPIVVEQGEGESYYLPQYITVYNNKLYFTANVHSCGFELMEYDGQSSPGLVADIREGGAWSSPEGLTLFNNKLFFSANDGIHGRELWMLGTDNNPEMLSDIAPGEQGSDPSSFYVFNNKLYFSAKTGEKGYGLWEYDGENLPVMLTGMPEANPDFKPKELIEYDNKLWFYANNNVPELTLWFFNGDTIQELEGAPGLTGNNTYPMAVLDDVLYFVAADQSSGNELWAYSTGSAPHLLADIFEGEGGSDPDNLKTINNKLYFSANDGVNGSEVWEYNGQDNPVMLDDIYPGASGSMPGNFVFYNCSVLFRATDREHGSELWVYAPEPEVYIEEITSCGNFVTGGGQVINEAGIYSHTFTNTEGCDSIVELHLDIINVDAGVEQSGNILQALADGASFQWLDCDQGFNPIEGADHSQFTATENGNYAVEVTVGDCSEISECFSISNVGVDQIELSDKLIVYPNPSTGTFTIDLGVDFKNSSLRITDVKGLVLYTKKAEKQLVEIEFDAGPGIYFIHVLNKGMAHAAKIAIR
jgi:ELWxxDGT repeat protein